MSRPQWRDFCHERRLAGAASAPERPNRPGSLPERAPKRPPPPAHPRLDMTLARAGSPTAPSRRQRHARRPDGRLERRAAAATVTYARVAPGAPLGGPARPHVLSVDVCSHSTVGVLRALARFSPCRRPPPPSDRCRTPTLAGMTAVAHSAVRLSSALARPTFFLLCGLARARSSTRATSRRPCRSFCAGLELPSLMGARPARHSRTPWSAAPRALTPPTFAACAGSVPAAHSSSTSRLRGVRTTATGAPSHITPLARVHPRIHSLTLS